MSVKCSFISAVYLITSLFFCQLGHAYSRNSNFGEDEKRWLCNMWASNESKLYPEIDEFTRTEMILYCLDLQFIINNTHSETVDRVNTILFEVEFRVNFNQRSKVCLGKVRKTYWPDKKIYTINHVEVAKCQQLR